MSKFTYLIVALIAMHLPLASPAATTKTVTLKSSTVENHLEAWEKLTLESVKPRPDKKIENVLKIILDKTNEEMADEVCKTLDLGKNTCSLTTDGQFHCFFSKASKDTIEVAHAFTTFNQKNGKVLGNDHSFTLKTMKFNRASFEQLVQTQKAMKTQFGELVEKSAKEIKIANGDIKKIADIRRNYEAETSTIIKTHAAFYNKLEKEVRAQLSEYGVTEKSKLYIDAIVNDFTVTYSTPTNDAKIARVRVSIVPKHEDGKVSALGVLISESVVKKEQLPNKRD